MNGNTINSNNNNQSNISNNNGNGNGFNSGKGSTTNSQVLSNVGTSPSSGAASSMGDSIGGAAKTDDSSLSLNSNPLLPSAFDLSTDPVNQPTNQGIERENLSISSHLYSRYRDSEVPFNAPNRQANNPSSTSVATASNYSAQASSAHGQAMFNWQASKATIKERLSTVFNRETLADIHFLVGKDSPPVRIPAHKFILSIGSAVFDAMFNGKMATSDEEIELPDVEPPAFVALLRFLYTDEVQIGPETVMMTLYTAKKYAVPALEKACVEFLKQNLSSDNAFMLLTQARLFDENVLAQMCLDSIDKNTVEALTAEGFLEIDHDTLCMVLQRDTLRIREVVLFTAVVRWAEEECRRQSLSPTAENMRKVLGKALYLIRIPLMTVEEFAAEVAQSGILTDRELVSMFLYFIVNPKPSVQFPDVPRCCITGKEQLVCRFARTESRWGYSGTSDRIRFIVDRRIFVIGFALYGSIHGPSDYECNLQIIHTGTGKVLASNDTSFSCDGSANTFRVMFKMPVEILPNTNYTACATLKGSDSHYGTAGSRKVSVDLHGGGKVTFQFSYAAGCNNGTSVEDGQIPEIIFYT